MTKTAYILVGIMVIGISGCAKTVYVPVSSCPEPPQCGTNLSIKMLPSNANIAQQLEALRFDYIELYKCKLLLDGYRAK